MQLPDLGRRLRERAPDAAALAQDAGYGARPQAGCRVGRSPGHTCQARRGCHRSIREPHRLRAGHHAAAIQNRDAELQAFCESAGLDDIMQISVEDLDAYRAARKYSPITAAKEPVILRQFFGFCFERPWIEANVAKKIKTPRHVKPEEVRPYTQAEITKMIAACDAIGHDDYTRLCARAVVLLLRYTGLRFSDVATLERNRVRDGQILLQHAEDGWDSVPPGA